MKIAVLGSGAMGGLYSSYLSRHNEVTVIDVNAALVEKVNAEGLEVQEPDGTSNVFHPHAVLSTEGMEPVDLIIVFVKAMFSEGALNNNKGIIGPDTYIMTLQNGSGHEDLLGKFVPQDHIIIGVQKMIWNKLFTNVSASALTGALQVPLGYISSNEHAWKLCCQLIREAVDAAAGLGMDFDYDEKVAEVKAVCDKSPNGLTSIYADLRAAARSIPSAAVLSAPARSLALLPRAMSSWSN